MSVLGQGFNRATGNSPLGPQTWPLDYTYGTKPKDDSDLKVREVRPSINAGTQSRSSELGKPLSSLSSPLSSPSSYSAIQVPASNVGPGEDELDEKKSGGPSPASSGSDLGEPILQTELSVPPSSSSSPENHKQRIDRLTQIINNALNTNEFPGHNSPREKKFSVRAIEVFTSFVNKPKQIQLSENDSLEKQIQYLDEIKTSFPKVYHKSIETIKQALICLNEFCQELAKQPVCCKVHEPGVFEQIARLENLLKKYKRSAEEIRVFLDSRNSTSRKKSFGEIHKNMQKMVEKLRGLPNDSACVIKAKIGSALDRVPNWIERNLDRIPLLSEATKKGRVYQTGLSVVKAAIVGATVAYTLPVVVGAAEYALDSANEHMASQFVVGMGRLALSPLRAPESMGAFAESRLGQLGTAIRWVPTVAAAATKIFPAKMKKIWDSRVVDGLVVYGYKVGKQAIQIGYNAAKDPKQTVQELKKRGQALTKTVQNYFDPPPQPVQKKGSKK